MAEEETTTATDTATAPDPVERLVATIEGLEQRDNERWAGVQKQVDDTLAKLADKPPTTPSKITIEAGAVTRDEYDLMWEDDLRGLTLEERNAQRRANFEMCRMIMGGCGPRVGNAPIEPSERFMQCYNAAVFESGQRIWIADDKGRATRTMNVTDTGYGLELVGTQYIREIWEAARNEDGLFERIRSIPMTDALTYVPIGGEPPEMLFVGESTSASATAYTTTKTATSRVSLAAKKFTIQQIWSGELNEDSIIAFVPFLRTQLNRSVALHIGSAYLNGDDTNANTNINTDADPDDTKHYLAWDGIRHYWLHTATAQGKDMAGVLDPVEITRARGKLNGGDDDVDAGLKSINWGKDPRRLLLVADWDTYMAMLDLNVVQTIDKYGAQATVVTGELGSYQGIPIISPPYASKTQADGDASGTEANNTKGQISLFNPDAWLGGVRRDVQLFFDRIQRTDQFLFELYLRRAFTRYGSYVAAGIYDITL